MNRLKDAPGPWRIESEQYVWITWIALDEEQLEVLSDFFQRTRREFQLDDLYFDQCAVNFSLARRSGMK